MLVTRIFSFPYNIFFSLKPNASGNILCLVCKPIFFPMKVIATGFIPLSPLSLVSKIVGKQTVTWKEYFTEYCLKDPWKRMGKCTGRHDMTEIRFKTALTPYNQSVNRLQMLSAWKSQQELLCR